MQWYRIDDRMMSADVDWNLALEERSPELIRALTAGKPMPADTVIHLKLFNNGVRTDWRKIGGTTIPLVSVSAGDALTKVAANDVQLLPAEIPGAPGYAVVNILNRVAACASAETVDELIEDDPFGEFIEPTLRSTALRGHSLVRLLERPLVIASELVVRHLETARLSGMEFRVLPTDAD